MNAAAYYRVSSKAQDLGMQSAAVVRAAQARGDQINAIYAEKQSAKTMDRPELARLRAHARAGLISRLYVYRLDRLTRTGIRDTLEIVEEFRCHGVELVSIADGFDLNGPAAEIILAVLSWAAKMERLAINERIAAARARMEGEGRPWGRPRRGTTEQMKRAHQLRDKGKTVREIARALKTPRSTVDRWLKADHGYERGDEAGRKHRRRPPPAVSQKVAPKSAAPRPRKTLK